MKIVVFKKQRANTQLLSITMFDCKANLVVMEESLVIASESQPASLVKINEQSLRESNLGI